MKWNDLRAGWGHARRFLYWAAVVVIGILILEFATASVVLSTKALLWTKENVSKPDRVVWSRAGNPRDCQVENASGIWVVLRCDKPPVPARIAPLAGVQVSQSNKDARDSQLMLDRFWNLAHGGTDRSALKCALVSVTANDPKVAIPFASCTINDANVAPMLIALGAAAAPADNSPASVAMTGSAGHSDRVAMAQLASDQEKETRRATELSTESWVATLWGFVGAGVGLFYSSSQRYNQFRRRHRLLRERLSNSLDNLIDTNSKANVEELQQILITFLEFQGRIIPHAATQAFDELKRALENNSQTQKLVNRVTRDVNKFIERYS